MPTSDDTKRRLEQDAELLMVYHLDLLAQLESQLRAVQHTMRHIEKLRSIKHRVGPELSDQQRENTLAALDAEIAELDSHLTTEHTCCADMHDTITAMQSRVADLRRLVGSNKRN
jgi:hypothetical protein